MLNKGNSNLLLFNSHKWRTIKNRNTKLPQTQTSTYNVQRYGIFEEEQNCHIPAIRQRIEHTGQIEKRNEKNGI